MPGGDQASRDEKTCGDVDSPNQTKTTVTLNFGSTRRSEVVVGAVRAKRAKSWVRARSSCRVTPL